VYGEPSHWLHEISLFKTVCHHFSPMLMQGQNFADNKHSWGTHWELDGKMMGTKEK
jgi:hypothetical protein